MYQQPTTNLTNALKSIATLNTSDRDLLLAVLGTQQPTANNKPENTKNAIAIQQNINAIIKYHNIKGYKQNLKRLKNTQKIVSYFPKATNSCLS